MQTISDLNITINDLSIGYCDEGDKHTMAIVFIHGFPLTKTMWNQQRELLRTQFRVITYDIRGYGSSEAGGEELSIDLLASDLIHLLDALNIEKAMVCGFSLGGYIALKAIEKHPERFEALILCDTQCGKDTEDEKEKRIKAIDSIRNDGVVRFADQMLKNFFYEGSDENKSKEIIEVRSMIECNSVDVLCDTIVALSERDQTCSTLDKINVPVLILVGSEDTITSPAKAAFMQSKIKSSTLYQIDNAAHLSNIDNPVVFNKHLLDFVNAVSEF